MKVWMIWDQFVLKLLKIKPLDQDHLLLKVKIRKYYGKNIHFSDGENIQKGDYVVELHLNNDYLFRLGLQDHSPFALSIQLVRSMEVLLPRISEYISCHPLQDKITGIYGISTIHRGARQFGFTTMELPKGVFSFFVTKYLRLLFFCVHPEGKKQVKNKRNGLIPKIIAMSKNELLKRYPIQPISAYEDKTNDTLDDNQTITECAPT